MKWPTIAALVLIAVFFLLSSTHNVAWVFAALLTIKLWAAFAIGYFVMTILITLFMFVKAQ